MSAVMVAPVIPRAQKFFVLIHRQVALPVILFAMLPCILTLLFVWTGFSEEIVFFDAATSFAVVVCYVLARWYALPVMLVACGLLVLSVSQQSFNIGWDELLFLARNGGLTEYRNWWLIIVLLATLSVGMVSLIPWVVSRYQLKLRFAISILVFAIGVDLLVPDVYAKGIRLNIFSTAERNLLLERGGGRG